MRRSPLAALAIAALAALSLGLSACGGSDDAADETPTATPPPAATAAPVAGASTIAVDADPAGALAFTQTVLTTEAGAVTLSLTNASPVPHNIAVKGNGVDSEPSATITDGGTADLTVDLPAGEYEFYCEVAGHEAAGMVGTLTVR